MARRNAAKKRPIGPMLYATLLISGEPTNI